MITTITYRPEHVNINGVVPTISEVAYAAKNLGRNPRMVVNTALDNTVMIRFEAGQKRIEQLLLKTFTAAGWSFTYAAIGSDTSYGKTQLAEFNILVTL